MKAPRWVALALSLTFPVPQLGRVAASPQTPFTIPLREYVTVFHSTSGDGVKHQLHVSEYYGRVAVGSPPQEFDVVFDTGSGNVVLPTIKCTDEACQQHRRFASTASATAVQVAFEDGTPIQGDNSDRDTTTITYGTGRLTGEYIKDKLCLLGAGGGNDAVCTMSNFLGVVQESRFPFIELPFDGIVGLGLDGLSVAPGFNLVRSLRSNSTLSNPVFAVFLRDLQAAEESEISLGGYRSEHLADGATLRWFPVLRNEATTKGYWLITMRDVYVNGIPMGFCDDLLSQSARCKVALDTGSSLMIGPSMEVKELLRTVGGCSGGELTLPAIHFALDAEDGTTFELVLSPEDYMERSSEGGCSSAFQPMDLPPNLGNMWVFGQTALRKYYSVYDASNWRVGLGLARHTAERATERTSTASPPVSLVPGAQKEPCQDDTVNMVSNHLPGCHSFAAMGYCRRFGPVARHFCPLSCGECSGVAVATAGTAIGSPEAPATSASAALAVGSANPSAPSPLRRRGRLAVRGTGMSVSKEKSVSVPNSVWSGSAFTLPV